MKLVFIIPRYRSGEIPSSLCSSVLLAPRSQNFDRLRMTGRDTAQRADDIQGCAVMHTVFNGILRYSACTTDE
ncbi:MAG: hypothetical protein IJE25_02110 [Clostridia bacterium]|nr:hypothetical protein [Clostridia bacterium]